MEILSYFLRKPQAVDDVEGIARWRLLDEAVNRNLNEVAEALQWLVAEGFLMRESPHVGPPVFCLNPHNAAAARSLLTKARQQSTDTRE